MICNFERHHHIVFCCSCTTLYTYRNIMSTYFLTSFSIWYQKLMKTNTVNHNFWLLWPYFYIFALLVFFNWSVVNLGFPGGSVVKNPPAIPETWVRSLGQEDPLEKELASHSSIFAWEIPWTEEPGGLQSMGSQRVRHKLAIKQQQL